MAKAPAAVPMVRPAVEAPETMKPAIKKARLEIGPDQRRVSIEPSVSTSRRAHPEKYAISYPDYVDGAHCSRVREFRHRGDDPVGVKNTQHSSVRPYLTHAYA